jgi:signal-transduction protein with cAMP-binding, CBS, and nucleotidyltransferase domain
MKIEQIALRPAITVAPSATLAEAARAMADSGVGSLAVIDHDVIVGIVTDRDLVVHGVAGGVPLDGRIDGVMTIGVVTVEETADVREVIRLFGQNSIRRIPVMRHGAVVGMVTFDDLIVALTEELSEVTRGVAGQLMFPHANDPVPTPATLR